MSDKQSDVGENRRSILKMLATTGTAGATGIVGAGLPGVAARSNGNATKNVPASERELPDNVITENGRIVGFEDSDVKIEDTDIVTGGRARREAQGAMGREEIRALRDWFHSRGLRPNVKGSVASEITYEDNAVNEDDPIVVSIPYVPTRQEEGQGGLFNVFMVDDGPKRVAAGASGYLSERDGDDLHVTVIGPENGEASVVFEGTKKGGFSASQSIECASCQIVYDAICFGTWGSVGTAGCAFSCLATGPGWPVCTVVCSAVVSAISAYGCFYSGNHFCSNMVDFCA